MLAVSSSGVTPSSEARKIVSSCPSLFSSCWAVGRSKTASVAPPGAYTVALDPPRRAALRDELRRLLGEPSGAFTLTARAWWVAGRVPAG